MSKLKKTIFIICASLFIIGALTLAFFEATSDKDTPSSKSLNEIIVEDYNSVVDTLSDSTSLFFYEVETVLNGKLDELPIDSIRVIEYDCIIQTDKNVHFINRKFPENSRDTSTIYNDTWGGCFEIDSPYFPISFEQALSNIYSSGLEIPHTKFMTLRHPISLTYENPIYIFGNGKNGGLCVDAFTGEVKIFY